MTGSGPARPLLVGLLALLLAVGASLAPAAAADVRAATPDLTLVTDARYEVLPEEALVRVSVDILATNRLRDTATRRYYFDRAFLAVLPGTTGFSISGGSGKPTVRVSQSTADYNVLQVNFGQRISSGANVRFRLRFDLPDPGGAAGRDVRVGASLVSFPAWAYGSDSTPGSTVTIVFPPGFTVQLEAGDLPEPRTDEQGRTIFESGVLEQPLDFFAFFVADRPGTYAETHLSPVVGDRTADLVVRSWPDDPEWAERVGALFAEGLPVLHGLTGLPWSREDVLVVQQTVARSTGGYAGLFDPVQGKIEVAYYADAYVVLHEAAHAWFNAALLADRWANEAFASWYALAAAAELGEAGQGDELTEVLREAAIPLNAWGAVGSEERATEDYAYAASLELARLIAARAGNEGLRRVWQAAAASEGAYQPPKGGPAEPAGGAPDWRGLLDLLEEHTDASYDDLWREWVVRDGEAGLLDERLAAREEYRQVVTAAGPWQLPGFVRGTLRAWQFDQATTFLAEAEAVLAQRDALAAAAAAARLTPSEVLRDAFESEAGFPAAALRAEAELATVDVVAAARASRMGETNLVEALGLVGTEPDLALARAEAAFAEGDLATAVVAAVEARDTWLGAGDVGRNRLLTIAGAAILVLLALVVVFSGWRRHRARRRERAVLVADGPSDSSEPPVAPLGG